MCPPRNSPLALNYLLYSLEDKKDESKKGAEAFFGKEDTVVTDLSIIVAGATRSQ